jgi:uncharacterized membrane protein (UPF0127 family)
MISRSAGAVAGLLLLGAPACNKKQPERQTSPSARNAARSAPRDPSAQDYPMAPLPRGRVVLRDAYGGTHPVDVEVAATDEARTRGTMWRTELAEGKGMLFIFPGEQVRSFWMRNTLISLDMIFISADRVIVGIVPQAAPKTLTSRSVKAPSQYVLEVPGGWAERVGIQRGSSVAIEGAASKVAPQ